MAIRLPFLHALGSSPGPNTTVAPHSKRTLVGRLVLAPLLLFSLQSEGKPFDLAGFPSKKEVRTEDGVQGQARTAVQSPDGALWVGWDGQGVSRRDAGDEHVFGLEAGLPSPVVYALAVDPHGHPSIRSERWNGSVWAATEKGVATWDGSRWMCRPGLGQGRFLGLFADDKRLAILAESALYIRISKERGGPSSTHPTKTYPASGTKTRWLRVALPRGYRGSSLVFHARAWWVATQKGLLQWDGKQWRRVGRSAPLYQVALWKGNLVAVGAGQWSLPLANEARSLPEGEAKCAVLPSGQLVFYGDFGFIDANGRPWVDERGQPLPPIRAAAADHEALLLWTDDALLRLPSPDFEALDALKTQGVHPEAKIVQEGLTTWLGTNKGLWSWSVQTGLKSEFFPGGQVITGLHVRAGGELVVASEGGLWVRRSDGTWLPPLRREFCLGLAHSGGQVIALFGSKSVRLEWSRPSASGGPSILVAKDSTQEDFVVQVAGPFAQGTLYGLNVEGKIIRLQQDTKGLRWVPFSAFPGAPISSLRRDVNARLWAQVEGRGWWLHTSKGWVRARLRSNSEYTVDELPVQWRNGLWYGQHVSAARRPSFAPQWKADVSPSERTARVTFRLSGPRRPEELEYRFRLNKGHWSAWSSTQETVWPLLPLGTNTLSVSVRNARNLRALGTYQTAFVVPRPWYAHPVVWVLIVGFLVGAMGLGVRARRQRLAERKAWQVEKEDLEKRALRLQMNPHFLFNALESISGFVLQSQPKEAVGYLQRFAKLMRLTLQSAQKSWIPLADEWHLLEHYIALEQVRFNRSFEVVWEPDASIDPEELALPPMVLQPVVENAILHGLRPLTHGGLLLIRWEKVDENRLAITVEDNGVGRQAAAKAVRTDETRHRSAATSLLVARLDHLAQQFGPGIGWTTTDLTHPDGTPAGTRVTLVVPVENLETF